MAVTEVKAEDMFQKGFDDDVGESEAVESKAIETPEKPPETVKEGQPKAESEKDNRDKGMPEIKAEEKSKEAIAEKADGDNQEYKQKWKSLQGIIRSKDVEMQRLRQEIVKAQTPLTLKTEDNSKTDSSNSELASITETLGEDMAQAINHLFDKKLSVVRGEYDKQITDIHKEYETKINPMYERAVEEGKKQHFKAIKDAHGDVNKYIVKEVDDAGAVIGVGGEILDWIEEQPDGLKDTYLDIFHGRNNRGSTDASIRLIDQFKKDRGYDKQPVPKPVINNEDAKNISGVKIRRSPINLETKINGSGSYEDGWANG